MAVRHFGDCKYLSMAKTGLEITVVNDIGDAISNINMERSLSVSTINEISDTEFKESIGSTIGSASDLE